MCIHRSHIHPARYVIYAIFAAYLMVRIVHDRIFNAILLCRTLRVFKRVGYGSDDNSVRFRQYIEVLIQLHELIDADVSAVSFIEELFLFFMLFATISSLKHGQNHWHFCITIHVRNWQIRHFYSTLYPISASDSNKPKR